MIELARSMVTSHAGPGFLVPSKLLQPASPSIKHEKEDLCGIHLSVGSELVEMTLLLDNEEIVKIFVSRAWGCVRANTPSPTPRFGEWILLGNISGSLVNLGRFERCFKDP